MLDEFAIHGSLRFEPGAGDLTRAVITTPACTGQLYLHGAHVTSWTPKAERSEASDPTDVLFLSDVSQFRAGTAIRGGVPICLPWFGRHPSDPKAPIHGTVRLRAWDLHSTRLESDAVSLTLTTRCDNLLVTFHASFGRQLAMTLTVTNQADAPAVITEALHTYFAVSHPRKVYITGLQGTHYYSKVHDARFTEQNEQLHFDGETDRVYFNTEATCLLHDPTWHRRIVVAKTGSRSTVVWNPGSERFKNSEDLGGERWDRFVCIETANALDNAITIAPGAEHSLSAQLSVERD
ncbi:MAG: D-hexose-6-phosphate mutarotase [Phycisphaeraceae bacterium]|nr:D-hexose-6-phosphate mutarotase [Phycisphaeraceae bacterium]